MKTGCLLLVLLLAVTAHARADEFETLKASVQRRSSDIRELKRRGVFREGNKGLLECTSPEIDPAQRALLESENAARTRLFQLIAQRAGAPSPEAVAQAFVQALPPVTDDTSPTGSTFSSPGPPTPSPPSPSRPLLESTSHLPLKVLTRPFANVYSSPDDHAQKVRENTPAFTTYFVYQKNDGWYEVGSDTRGKKVGWMHADDVVEWKHDLVVQFTHPEGRLPVLMFGDKAALSQLVAAPRNTRVPKVSGLYGVIAGGQPPPGFPVHAREPRRGLPRLSQQSQDQFYLLPIIDFEETEIDGRESRLLQLAASARKRGAIPLVDTPADPNGDITSSVQVDVVFVMDLTRSMGPFAERTLELITESIKRFETDPKVLEAIRFGFWGYRDFPELCHGIEYNTRNYTPELQELSEFARTLRTVQETKVDSIDYEEDVLAGVADAIQKTHWRPDAIRNIVVVSDAPGRPPKESDPYCTVSPRPIGTKAGMNAESIRHLADERQVYISALYLKTPKWKRYEQIGERQFRTLSHNPNVQPGTENFRFINARDTALYHATAQSLTNSIIECVRAAQSHRTPPPEPRGTDHGGGGVDTPEDASKAGRELASKMFEGALVEWLARKDAAPVPRDVTVWAADKDLIDPTIQSLEVQIFLTKNQLNSLKVMVDQILEAGTRGKMTGEDFFEALRAVVAATTRTPDQIRNAETLVKTGLVPGFLNGLPYHSTLMEMSNDNWRNMSPDAQDQFLRQVESKLRFYQEIHDNSEKWQPLNEGDDRDDWVANVPLEELP